MTDRTDTDTLPPPDGLIYGYVNGYVASMGTGYTVTTVIRLLAERDERIARLTKALAALEAERDALRNGLAAALDFAGTVAGGASWWDDVWAEHEARIDAAREADR